LVVIFAESSAAENAENNKVLLSSKIEIKQGPAELVGELEHHGALFGRNFFGKSVEKKLYYTKRSLCDGQIPGTPDYIKQDGYFLLVDRGECSFVEKVRNAQKDGAIAVFIADDRCLCSVNESCGQDLVESCEKIEPFMDDDGSGSDIEIPSMLLLKSDADGLRDAIISGTAIETMISFPVPKATNGRTEYTLFTSPDDRLSRQFLDSFLEAALAFGSKAVFRPRMLVSNGTEKGCRQYDESHVPCKSYCTNYGRYCEFPSFYDKEHYDDKGTKIIVESMRRTCIWNIYGRVDGIGKEWWAYVQLWTLKCSFSHYSTSCAESIYETAGVDKEEVEICMENAGDFRENVLNTLMETSLSDINKYQVNLGPTLVINGAIINGALNFGNVMEAICSTFADAQRPEICGKWDVCSNVCSNNTTCILWGENQECSEYMAPFLSNDGKQFDDDYLILEIEDETTMMPPSPNNYTSPSEQVPIKSLEIENSDIMEDQREPSILIEDESSKDFIKIIPEAQEREDTDSTRVYEPHQTTPTSGTNLPETVDGNDVKDRETPYFHDGQHEFLETIQIYETSDSGLIIGLGIGFGSAFLLVFICFIISRERDRQIEHLIASGRIPGRVPRKGLFRSRRRYYTSSSDESETTNDQLSDDDQFSDEENHFGGRRKERNHHDNHHRSPSRQERWDFPQKSKRKSRVRHFRERSSLKQKVKHNECEIPLVRGRNSSIREMINDEEFPIAHYKKNDSNQISRKNSGNIDGGDEYNDR